MRFDRACTVAFTDPDFVYSDPNFACRDPDFVFIDPAFSGFGALSGSPRRIFAMPVHTQLAPRLETTGQFLFVAITGMTAEL